MSAATFNAYLAAAKACIRSALRGASLQLTGPELRVIEDSVAELKGKKKPSQARTYPTRCALGRTS